MPADPDGNHNGAKAFREYMARSIGANPDLDEEHDPARQEFKALWIKDSDAIKRVTKRWPHLKPGHPAILAELWGLKMASELPAPEHPRRRRRGGYIEPGTIRELMHTVIEEEVPDLIDRIIAEKYTQRSWQADHYGNPQPVLVPRGNTKEA